MIILLSILITFNISATIFWGGSDITWNWPAQGVMLFQNLRCRFYIIFQNCGKGLSFWINILKQKNLIALHSFCLIGSSKVLVLVLCHRFRLMKQDEYVLVNFDHFWIKQNFLRLAGAVLKLGSSLKPNHHQEI